MFRAHTCALVFLSQSPPRCPVLPNQYMAIISLFLAWRLRNAKPEAGQEANQGVLPRDAAVAAFPALAV